MSLEESIRQSNLNTIEMMFILATIILLAALVQKLKPTFSLSYPSNHRPSYLKAKLMAKLVTSAAIYLWGLYCYYFTDLSKRSGYGMWAVPISIMMYHGCKWGLTKISELRDKNNNL